MKKPVKIFMGFIAIIVALNIMFIVVTAFNYMHKQNFSLDKAVQWAFEDWVDLMPKKEVNGEVVEYPMVNQNISVVACTALK